MNTTNLKELRELRNQEKAIKARIDEISTEATNEAVAILAEVRTGIWIVSVDQVEILAVVDLLNRIALLCVIRVQVDIQGAYAHIELLVDKGRLAVGVLREVLGNSDWGV